MKYFLLLLCFGVILSSCNNSTDKPGKVLDSAVVYNGVDELDDQEKDSLTFAHDSLFTSELVGNMRDMSENERTHVLASDMYWDLDSLSRSQYVTLFNYLLDHEDSDLDEPIADFIFEYYKDKDHFKEFDKYFKLYSDPCILEALTFEVLSSWSNENESISEDDFKTKFEYLYKNGCLTYYEHFISPEK